jgi:hypothetical protein
VTCNYHSLHNKDVTFGYGITVEDRLSRMFKHLKHPNNVIIEGRFGIVQQKIVHLECLEPDQLWKNRLSGAGQVPDIPDK